MAVQPWIEANPKQQQDANRRQRKPIGASGGRSIEDRLSNWPAAGRKLNENTT
jgi:hypothetical protein